MREVRNAEEQRRKRWQDQEWNARMSSLHAVQRFSEGRSGTTAADSTADDKREQGRVEGLIFGGSRPEEDC